MKAKKLLSLALIFSLIFTSFGFNGNNKVEAQEVESVVLDAVEFGLIPNTGEDSIPKLKEFIELGKKYTDEGKSIVLNFPEGRYDFYPDKAYERELYVSNTVGLAQGFKNKKIGFLFEDMDNVTVNGNGSLFMFHGKMTTFATIDCENFTLQNAIIDYERPQSIDVTVESVDGNTAIVHVPEVYEYEIQL